MNASDWDIVPKKSLKVICYPIVGDINLVIIKLDGQALHLGRFPIALSLVGQPHNEALHGFTEGCETVSIERWIELANEHASIKSKENFAEEWRRIYGRS